MWFIMGVLSDSVPQRTWKIGFRMTLGARQMDVFGFAFLCLASSTFAGQAVKLTPSTSLTAGAFTTTGTNVAFGLAASRRVNSARHQ